MVHRNYFFHHLNFTCSFFKFQLYVTQSFNFNKVQLNPFLWIILFKNYHCSIKFTTLIIFKYTSIPCNTSFNYKHIVVEQMSRAFSCYKTKTLIPVEQQLPVSPPQQPSRRMCTFLFVCIWLYLDTSGK